MDIHLYVVRLGGKLYIESNLYNLYQSTTKDISHAYFFTDLAKAERLAKRTRGEVVTFHLVDEE